MAKPAKFSCSKKEVDLKYRSLSQEKFYLWGPQAHKAKSTKTNGKI